MLTAPIVTPPINRVDLPRHRAVAVENLALRQQPAALTRTRKRRQFRRTDRLVWIHSVAGVAHCLDGGAASDGAAVASPLAPSPMGWPLETDPPGTEGRIVAVAEEVGRLHHRYERRAA